MAKGRRDHDKRTRDHLRSLVAPSLRSPLIKPSVPVDLRLLEDRRRFDPELARRAKAVTRKATQLVIDPERERKRQIFKDTLKYSSRFGPFNVKMFDEAPYLRPDVRFRLPKLVAICVRRKIRKEIMHASGHAGKGRKHFRQGKPKAKWNEFSLIKC